MNASRPRFSAVTARIEYGLDLQPRPSIRPRTSLALSSTPRLEVKSDPAEAVGLFRAEGTGHNLVQDDRSIRYLSGRHRGSATLCQKWCRPRSTTLRGCEGAGSNTCRAERIAAINTSGYLSSVPRFRGPQTKHQNPYELPSVCNFARVSQVPLFLADPEHIYTNSENRHP